MKQVSDHSKVHTNRPSLPTIKLIFDRYADDTISEEQVNRILEPVVSMIRGERNEPGKCN